MLELGLLQLLRLVNFHLLLLVKLSQVVLRQLLLLFWVLALCLPGGNLLCILAAQTLIVGFLNQAIIWRQGSELVISITQRLLFSVKSALVVLKLSIVGQLCFLPGLVLLLLHAIVPWLLVLLHCLLRLLLSQLLSELLLLQSFEIFHHLVVALWLLPGIDAGSQALIVHFRVLLKSSGLLHGLALILRLVWQLLLEGRWLLGSLFVIFLLHELVESICLPLLL